MALFRKKQAFAFDPEKEEPAVRRSICTGEMTLGLIDRKSGIFREVMRVDGQRELDEICQQAGITNIRTIY